MSEQDSNSKTKRFQIVINNISGEKNIYNLKKTLMDTLNISLETSQNMLSRGPFVIGKFDQIESEHWMNILKKLEADAELIDEDICPLHKNNPSREVCAICKTNICNKCSKKLGLKNICELCAVDFDADKPDEKRNILPLLLLIIAFSLLILFFFSNRKDRTESPAERRARQVKEEIIKAEPDLELDDITEVPEEDTDIITKDDPVISETEDEFGLIFEQDIETTDLGQIGFVVFRSKNGIKEPTEFFTEKDLSFNIAILLEFANTPNKFEVSFLGPDGEEIKTQRKTLQAGEKEAEFQLRRNEIRHKYGNEFIFATYFAIVKMNDQFLGNIPIFYNPSEDFIRNDLPGLPPLDEISIDNFRQLGNTFEGPWIVIFYRDNHPPSQRLLQASRILSVNPGFLIPFFQMNADRNPGIMEHFNISDYPATAVLVKNRVINIIYGFRNSDEFIESISIAINRFYDN